MRLANLRNAITGGVLSPSEHVEDVLRQLDSNPYNAVVELDHERALDAARLRTNELTKGINRGPLHGVAVGIKDMIDVEGIPTRCGSRLFADRPDAQRDARIVARLRELGAVIIGKVHTHEFAYGPTGDVSASGPCRNPYDHSRISGGSSSGSAALVAGGQLPLTIGTDTAGSVRIPAALCGVVGLKPQYGRLPTEGVFPLSESCDHLGIIAEDPHSAELAWSAISERRGSWNIDEVRQLTIGRASDEYWTAVHPDVADAIERTCQLLIDMGARVIDVATPQVSELSRLRQKVAGPEAYATHRDSLARRPDLYSEAIAERIFSARATSATEYIQAQHRRRFLSAQLRSALADVDCLLTPTTPFFATPIGVDSIDGVDVRTALLSMTSPFNLTGWPAVSLPMHQSSAVLPLGVQLVGVRLDECALLELADAIWNGHEEGMSSLDR